MLTFSLFELNKSIFTSVYKVKDEFSSLHNA